jgi:hypothetical protein
MSVNVETTCNDVATSAPLNSLEKTTGAMHRISVCVRDLPTWYAIMAEARRQFGRNWRAQPKVKRKIERQLWMPQDQWVWFEVPDPAFVSWISVKLGVRARIEVGK